MKNLNELLEGLKQKAQNVKRDYTPIDEIYRLDSFINWWISLEDYEENKIYGGNCIFIADNILFIKNRAWEDSKVLGDTGDITKCDIEDFMFCINTNIYLVNNNK